MGVGAGAASSGSMPAAAATANATAANEQGAAADLSSEYVEFLQHADTTLPVVERNSSGAAAEQHINTKGRTWVAAVQAMIAAARSAAADAAGDAMGVGAGAASSGSIPAAAATAKAAAASEQGAAVDFCSEYVECLKRDGVTLPVMERNSSGAAAELVEYKIMEKLGKGGFATVYRVRRVATDISAASSTGSSTGASSSQEFAMKVYTLRTSRRQATKWMQAISKQLQQSTLAAKQQQQQPGPAPKQQQGSVRAAGGPAAGRLQTSGLDADQQQRHQDQSQPAPASLQQQTSAAQHTAATQHRAASTSSGDSGMNGDASQQLEQQSTAVSDGSTVREVHAM
jgi:hypothetical protein